VNQLGKDPTDVWKTPKVTTGENLTGRRASPERTSHPAQFPVAVIERSIKACSMPGELILNPFVGSGTTTEVAIANDRVAVGFEIKSEYIKIALIDSVLPDICPKSHYHTAIHKPILNGMMTMSLQTISSMNETKRLIASSSRYGKWGLAYTRGHGSIKKD